jgi:invasion protein IalB
MSNTRFDIRTVCAALFLATVAVPAVAQTPPSAASAAAPAAAAPATEAKVIGDWGVHCFTGTSVSPCEMQQTAMQNNTGRRVLGMSLAYAPQNGRYIFQIAVPLGVSIAKGVKIVGAGYTNGVMAYRRCDAAGCYVEGIMDTRAVDMLAAISGPAKVEIASADGHAIDLPFSLRGFTEARKNMEDLARAKAAKP